MTKRGLSSRGWKHQYPRKASAARHDDTPAYSWRFVRVDRISWELREETEKLSVTVVGAPARRWRRMGWLVPDAKHFGQVELSIQEDLLRQVVQVSGILQTPIVRYLLHHYY